MRSTLSTVIQASRPKFLILAPICVLLGVAAADYRSAQLQAALIVVSLIIATLAHAGVNLLNEYADAKSGLDDLTLRTPFSGGSGALQQHPSGLNAVRISAYICLFLVCALGIFLILHDQLEMDKSILISIGAIGLLIVITYTPVINRSSLLCLLAPGIGFASLMIMGSYAVLTGRIDSFILLITVPIFFTVNNLLLLNQFPDAKADQQIGRQHAVIQYSYEGAARLYCVFALLSYLSLFYMLLASVLPVYAWLAMICVPASCFIAWKAFHFDPNNITAFLPALGLNVLVTLLLPVILASALWLG